MQLDLFQPENETMMDEINRLKNTLNNVRKGLFARHHELSKMYIGLKDDVDGIKRFVGYEMQSIDVVSLFQQVG